MAGVAAPASLPAGGLRLDAAVERLLLEPVDAATRVELERVRSAVQARDVAPEGLDPPSLVGEVFAYVMPRITDPGVLRLERRRSLLERVAARCAAAPEPDPATRGGLVALRRELRALATLRGNRDSLVEG